MARRLIIDLTDIWLYLARNSRVTGIQRVVLKQAEYLLAQDGIEALLGYYDPRFGVYAHFPQAAKLDNFEALREAVGSSFIKPFYPHKYINRPFRRLFKLLHTRTLQTIRYLLASPGFRPEPLTFQEGDVVLSLGWGCDAVEMFNLVGPLTKGGKISLVVAIHDMMPLPDADEPAVEWKNNYFHIWLSGLAPYVSGYVTVSKNTQRDLNRYLTQFGNGGARIEVFKPAHEFQPTCEQPPAGSTAAVTPGNYVLAVISYPTPHKNFARLTEVWARLAATLGKETMPRLVIAGGVNRTDLPDAMAEQLGDLIQVVHRPSDAELSFLYRNTLFTVFPSTYEGWGLPIGESLWMEKLCVTSNASSMPEVGGPLCDYFDPLDIDSMAGAIGRPIADRAYLASREAAIDRSKLLSWEQSAATLRDTVIRIASGF
jgi:glycosyltransferase involved in cell wall biosynthesis